MTRISELELYTSLKFNMHKLAMGLQDEEAARLAQFYDADEETVNKFLTQFSNNCHKQADILKSNGEIPTASGAKKIVFIGDSITSDRESYYNILKVAFADNTAVELIDAAISGDKTDDAKMRFYLRTINHKPDIVHILLGTNDMRQNNDANGSTCISIEEYKNNLCYMIKTLKEQNIHVIISTISPVNTKALQANWPEDNWKYEDDTIGRANQTIVEIADEFQAKLNDMRPVYVQYDKKEVLLHDGLHLNIFGQQLLAQKVLEGIKEWL